MIKILDELTINKIAAGEVVERPSSVVKELIENSIDAGATAVTVEIKDGGIAEIRISDNGKGIKKEEVKTAFIRHATEKIEKIEDLSEIYSLGFRGEALASIASVAKVTMITKTYEEKTGTLIELEGGKITKFEDISCSEGTNITVRDIFYNVPVRRKFLKKPATESGYISDVVNKISLSNPSVSFKYVNNGSLMLQTSGNNDLRAAVMHIYGKEIAKKMIPLDVKKNGYELKGLIAPPDVARANRTYELIFLNGRFIKNDTVSSACESAYKNRLMVGKFPFYILNLSISPKEVDVNVHPTKLEVRFSNENFIYDFIYNAVYSTLQNNLEPLKVELNKPKKQNNEYKNISQNSIFDEDIFEDVFLEEINVQKEMGNNIKESNKSSIKEENNDTSLIAEIFDEYNDEIITNIPRKNNKKALDKTSSVNEEKSTYEKNDDNKLDIFPALKKEEKKACFTDVKIVGQVFNTYWIIEKSNSMYIIDQHAAHERVLYEKFMKDFKEQKIASQRLLEPFVIKLTDAETTLLETNLDLFYKFGYEFEKFFDNSYALKSVPYIFEKGSAVDSFVSILDSLNENKYENIAQTKEEFIATSACKAAVKGNDKLSFSEAKNLIDELLKLENPFNCPHGRPTIIEITKYEIEKMFKRIV